MAAQAAPEARSPGASRWGSQRRPTRTKNPIPSVSITAPTGVKSKKAKGARPAEASCWLAMRLGAVPMRVSIPPRRAATDRGMRRREGATFRSRASPTTTGSMMATVPVEERKAERRPAMSMTVTRRLVSPVAKRAGRRARRSAIPVR